MSSEKMSLVGIVRKDSKNRNIAEIEFLANQLKSYQFFT
jgi:hypothetical protein